MLKWIVVVLLVVAVALGVWRLGGSESVKGLGTSNSGTTTEPLFPGESGVDLAEGGGDAAGERSTQGAGTRSAVPTDEAAAVAAARVAADGELVIETLHPGTDQPLVDLDVWLLDRNSRPAVEWQLAFQVEEQRLAYLRAHGVRHTTDEKGRITVERLSSGALLAEGQGQRGEFAWAGPVQGPVKVPMRPVVDLRVRVVDGDGTLVAGAPVAIIDDVLKRPRQRAMRPTTANGEASFTYLAQSLAKGADGVGYAVILNFPQSNQRRVSLDPKNLPTEPIELVMPPAAPMKIVLVDAAGEPVKGASTIALGVSGLGRNGQPSKNRAGFEVQVQQRTTSGSTRFPWVEVGSAFEILVTGAGTRADQVFAVTGPPAAGELYTLELVWDAQLPSLVGRAVGPDGAPLRSRHGRLRLSENRAQRQSSAFLCDEEGRFKLRIDETWTPGSERMGLLSMTQTDERGPLEAELDLSFDVPPGETDLGNVVFEGIPLLASGQVLDADGEPMAGAHAVAQYRKSGSDEGSWQNVEGAADTTGPDGWFTIYGEPLAKTLRISVRRRGFEGGQAPFEAGDREVQLVLTEGGAAEEDEKSGKE